MRRREIRPIQSGELRHFGRIERLVPTVDDSSNPIPVYESFIDPVRFSIDDFSVRETLVAQQVQSQLTTKIRIRFRPALEGAQAAQYRLVRVLDASADPPTEEFYDIQGSIRDINLRTELQLICIRRDAQGFRSDAVTSQTATSDLLTEGGDTITTEDGRPISLEG